ncbi:Tetratricopeptide TPR_1 repeat-containing protein [Oceanithermus profundus DSM 14977]|uniref:Tetratricopeptide TPR_1 repeat-containing protein n=1 Tax=Oceanithermus profundus (strain DSM 14977 / NBRC 100410 / VKM B-2274 / 506) TaxID=670487 RepID=E4U6K8_OCEP5|nr:tetratricopeptide repeat protein [Oceanithermus profundus]ADR35746.1 Tetratricopeptide TPR_1 repeat-containing protein [Oceanithermus profundus DSM 14977]
MRLRLLGSLELEGVRFTRPKPLLLLAYLALEGSRERRFLAELFWPEAKRPLGSLSVALTQLNKAHPGAVRTHGRRLYTPLPTDVDELIDAVARGEWARAVRLYGGAFAEGLDLRLGHELEEWVFQMRERVAVWVARAHLELGHQALHRGAFDRARAHAEAAYALERAWGLSDPATTVELLRKSGSPLLDDFVREHGRAEPVPCRVPRPVTRHLGRREELEAIERLLVREGQRWVTLVGLAGVGKTRTAIEAAQRFCRRCYFADGVVWVELDADADADLPARIAEALKLTPDPRRLGWEDLAARIDRRSVCIVLDGIERFHDQAGELARLVVRCPNLHLLATSRVRLGAAEERCLHLDGLSVDPEVPGEPSPAVALFLERARRVHAALGEGTAAVEELCRVWQGHPLAIELAASWADLFPAEELARRFSPPHLPRPRNGEGDLETLLEEAYEQLPSAARRVFPGLGVFEGGFDAEAATEVLGADVGTLAVLSDRAMVWARNGRLGLHPLLRQLALRRLARRPGEEAEVRAAHARHYLDRLLRHVQGLNRGDEPTLALMRNDHANLRAAWERAAAWGWHDRLAPLAEPLLRFFDRQGRFEEGRRWFEAVLARAEDGGLRAPFALAAAWLWIRLGDLEAAERLMEGVAVGADPARNARLEQNRGMLAYRRGDFAAAAEHWGRAAALAREGADPWARTAALQNRAIAVFSMGDHEAARRLFLEALATQEAHGHEADMAKTYNNLGNLLRVMGRSDEAERMLNQGLRRARRLGLGQIEPFLLYNLGQLALASGRYVDALGRFEAALEGSRRSRERVLEASCQINLGLTSAHLQRWVEAERHLRQGLAAAWRVGEAAEVARGLVVWARLELAQGDPRRACRLLRTALGLPELRAHNRREAENLMEALDPGACPGAPYRSAAEALEDLGVAAPA